MKEKSIGSRLLTAAGLVCNGKTVCDVGCDHGYLGIYLLTQGIATSVIESDVAEGPLQSAMRNAVKFGTKNKMSFHLSDGVKNIPRDFDTLVCAGMGADTIISILEAAPWTAKGAHKLVLQPMTAGSKLRRWLADNGYGIEKWRVRRHYG